MEQAQYQPHDHLELQKADILQHVGMIINIDDINLSDKSVDVVGSWKFLFF